MWARLRSPDRPGWRNGRRDGLKIRCPKGRVGSTPTPGTASLGTDSLTCPRRLSLDYSLDSTSMPIPWSDSANSVNSASAASRSSMISARVSVLVLSVKCWFVRRS